MAKQRLIFDFLRASPDIRGRDITEEERVQYEHIGPAPWEHPEPEVQDPVEVHRRNIQIVNGARNIQALPVPYEPKKNNRWILTLPEVMGINPWVVKSVPRPKLRARTEHAYGGYDFTPFWIKFYDPIGPSTTQKLWNIYLGITTNLEDFVVNQERLMLLRDDYSFIRNSGFDMTLEMLDPTGVPVEKWRMERVKILDFDFGELSYSDDDVTECGIKVKPGNIILDF